VPPGRSSEHTILNANPPRPLFGTQGEFFMAVVPFLVFPHDPHICDPRQTPFFFSTTFPPCPFPLGGRALTSLALSMIVYNRNMPESKKRTSPIRLFLRCGLLPVGAVGNSSCIFSKQLSFPLAVSLLLARRAPPFPLPQNNLDKNFPERRSTLLELSQGDSPILENGAVFRKLFNGDCPLFRVD